MQQPVVYTNRQNSFFLDVDVTPLLCSVSHLSCSSACSKVRASRACAPWMVSTSFNSSFSGSSCTKSMPTRFCLLKINRITLTFGIPQRRFFPPNQSVINPPCNCALYLMVLGKHPASFYKHYFRKYKILI